MQKISHHKLITIYSGRMDWAQVLSRELEDQAGKILVTGNYSSEH